jgi:hypothetical protein
MSVNVWKNLLVRREGWTSIVVVVVVVVPLSAVICRTGQVIRWERDEDSNE